MNHGGDLWSLSENVKVVKGVVPREGFEPPTARFLPEGSRTGFYMYPPGLTTAGRSTAELPGAIIELIKRVLRLLLYVALGLYGFTVQMIFRDWGVIQEKT